MLRVDGGERRVGVLSTLPAIAGQTNLYIMKKLIKNFITAKLRLELVFTVLAFSMMVMICYFGITAIIKEHLLIHAENTLKYADMQLQASREEAISITEDLRIHVERKIQQNGVDEADLKDYLKSMSMYFSFTKTPYSKYTGFFGFFLNDGDPFFVESFSSNNHGFDPRGRSWYERAIVSPDKIIEEIIYEDFYQHEIVLIYVQVLRLDEKIIGVIGTRIQVHSLQYKISNMLLPEEGYIILISPDEIVLIHPILAFIGMSIHDHELISKSDVIRNIEAGYGNVRGMPIRTYKHEEGYLFGKTFNDNWYLCVVTTKSPYFHQLSAILGWLIASGVVFAAILCVILIKISIHRAKATAENKNKSVFLANMSHEIRTPLSAIIGMTQIGLSSDTTEKKDQCFAKVNEASTHLLGVINYILDLSKIEANKFELSTVDFNFTKMLGRVENIVKYKVEAKHLELTIDIDPSIPKTMHGDDQRLTQVVTNLVGNSIKFTPDFGKISIRARLIKKEGAECTILVSVRDNGIGMKKEQQQKLFASFQQANSDISRTYGGTGLGLAISKSLVELMGGTISVESEENIGSTFTFTVKLLEVATSENEDNDFHQNIDDIFKGFNLLLVEDIELNREILMTLLAPTGINISIAENGRQAVREFETNAGKYDIVLMDVQMPVMGGLEATTEIRSMTSPYAKIVPIIAMTADVFKEDIDKCRRAGMDGHLGKPINMDAVIATLKRHLLSTLK